MYTNLERILKERKITKKELATFLRIRYATLVDKTNGNSRFFLDEAMLIKDKFFPDIEIEYLFATDDVAV